MYRREINKYIKQNCAPSWVYLRDDTGMYCQRNIKFTIEGLKGYELRRWDDCQYQDNRKKLQNSGLYFQLRRFLLLPRR